jgi:thiol-disulfide isomerase/thioredoxin
MFEPSPARRPLLRTWSAALLALSFLPGLALGAAGPAGEPASWPANTRVVEARLARMTSEISLPQLRAYDAQGRRVLSQEGYNRTFSTFFARALEGGGMVDDRYSLASELPRIKAPDGKPLAPLPAADFTIVEYWATWCAPCHAQARDMVNVLAAHPDVHVTLVRVEADITRQGGASPAPAP